jgi:hypothetical protein
MANILIIMTIVSNWVAMWVNKDAHDYILPELINFLPQASIFNTHW